MEEKSKEPEYIELGHDNKLSLYPPEQWDEITVEMEGMDGGYENVDLDYHDIKRLQSWINRVSKVMDKRRK